MVFGDCEAQDHINSKERGFLILEKGEKECQLTTIQCASVNLNNKKEYRVFAVLQLCFLLGSYPRVCLHMSLQLSF